MADDSLAATYMCRRIEMVNSHKLSSLLASKLFLLGMSKYVHIMSRKTNVITCALRSLCKDLLRNFFNIGSEDSDQTW